jgi:putative glutamine amidotransferase
MKNVLTISGASPYWSEGDNLPYVEALEVCGLRPVVASPSEAISLEGISGLLLMGGTDVDPSLYGAEPGPATEAPDRTRDAAELAILAAALDRDLPVLAICRGLQLLNVARGGTLIQNLEPVEVHRQLTEDRSLPAHDVRIEPGALLARAAGQARSWAVNSRHHQAIDRLGKGLRVTARNPADGVVEAVELPEWSFVLAVQWHPENQLRENGRRLFECFAEALLIAR